MFEKNTLVAWATKRNIFMGKVVESGTNATVVLVTSTDKGHKFDGKKMIVFNENLGNIESGKTIVNRV